MMQFTIVQKSLVPITGYIEAGILGYIYASISTKYNSQDTIDGVAWCYDTYATISQYFGISVKTTQRYLLKLKELDMVIVSQQNKHNGDLTNYYTLTEQALSHFITIANHQVKLTSPSSQIDLTHQVKLTSSYIDTNNHTNNHTNIKRNIKENKNTTATVVADKFSVLEASNESNLQNGTTLASDNKNAIQTTSDTIQDVFDKFWMLYPRKVVKSEANKLFLKLKIEDAKKIVDDINSGRIKFSEDTKFIPYPTTFLRQKRYLDVSDAPTIQQVYEFAANLRNDTKWARKVAEDYCKSNTTKDYQDYVKSYFYISKF